MQINKKARKMAKTAAVKKEAENDAENAGAAAESTQKKSPKPKAKRAPANGVKKAKNTSKYSALHWNKILCVVFYRMFFFAFHQNQIKLYVFSFFCDSFNYSSKTSGKENKWVNFYIEILQLDVNCVAVVWRPFCTTYSNKITSCFHVCFSFIQIAAAKANADEPKKPKHPPIAEMVNKAFSTLKDRKGNTMASIRKYITTEYQRELNKALLGHIKKYMTKEFEDGRIRMTNSDADTINFSMRFALVK